MRKVPPALMMLLTLGVAAGIVVWVLQRSDKSVTAEKIGFQDSAQPLGVPEDGKIDYRFQPVSAWTMARIPAATRWDHTMGAENGALTYNAQKFLELNKKRGGPHLGDDINGIGGMNTDLGDPVFATADGLVLYAGEPSQGWGNIVILAHRTDDEEILQSMYAHLDSMNVSVGSLVARGQRIGTNGTAHGNYPAHLHLEFRNSDHPDIGAGYSHNPLGRIDPTATTNQRRGVAADDLSPSALGVALQSILSWTNIEIKGAEHMLGLGSEEER